MTKEELEKWHDDIYWPAYNELVKTPFVTKYKSGPKGESKKRLIQMNPSFELRKRIVDAIQAQALHRRKYYEKLGSMQAWNEKTQYNNFYCNRHSKTWLNQMGWDDEIPSISEELQEQAETDLCGCGQPVHGPRFTKCVDCLAKAGRYEQDLRNSYRKMGLTQGPQESHEAWQARIREVGRKLLGGLRG